MNVLKNSLLTLIFAVSTLSLSACSNTNTVQSNGSTKVKNMQKVETGTVVSIKTIAIKPEKINSYGSVGVSVGSGGRGGIYGAVDLATLGKIFSNATKPKTAQQIIIKKSNGETVAITQATSQEIFKIGDSVKLLLQNGEAKVTH